MFLHACCGPCASEVAPYFAQQGHKITLFYFNPNIQPLAEFEIRRQGLMFFAQEKNFPLLISKDYKPLDFLEKTLPIKENRCSYCYALRLEKTGRKAKELGFQSFSTTLLVSPYQEYEKIREIGSQIAQKLDLEFLAPDLSHLYRQTIETAQKLNLYRQNYCGCQISEFARFRDLERGELE